ncbi:serine--tRNA ligase [Candidatus Paracaedimonas acanthamoebae]|nr:serine--tRNA ligase [Candidatus Paracaedimonas acanthamoebae]
MLDIKWIRENPESLDKALLRRGTQPLSTQVLTLDSERRAYQTQIQELQNERNTLARAIGEAKQQGLEPTDKISRANHIKELLPQLEHQEQEVALKLINTLGMIPNILFEEVPDGKDESDNIVIRHWSEPPSFNFTPKRHFEIGEALGLMDFKAAAKISGARFVVLKGDLARLERALGQFMLDLHSREHGYQEVSPPLLVRDETLFGTAQLPKMRGEQFLTTDGLWLIPTSEVSLTNLIREEILEESILPLRYAAYTPCFRSEAGAAGKDTRGMIRQHQFYKVELVSITLPKNSKEEHERMTKCAEEVLKRLNLPYRVMMLCAGDTGLSPHKTYDLEVWLPGENCYREISSCSNCGDYQARRMQARYRPIANASIKKSVELVHTLNGSGVAVGRALIAILENYQQEDGSVIIPEALRPYMNGQERISL